MASITEYRPACIIVGVVPPDAVTDELQQERGLLINSLAAEGVRMAGGQGAPAIDVVGHVLERVERSDLFSSRIGVDGYPVNDAIYAASLADGQRNVVRTLSDLTVMKYPSLVASTLLGPGELAFTAAPFVDERARKVAEQKGLRLQEPQEVPEYVNNQEASVSQVSRVGVVVFDGQHTAAGITASGTVGRPEEIMVDAVSGISARRYAGAAVVFGVPKSGRGHSTFTLAESGIYRLMKGSGAKRVLEETLEGLSETAQGAVALVNSIGKGDAGIVGPRPMIRRVP